MLLLPAVVKLPPGVRPTPAGNVTSVGRSQVSHCQPSGVGGAERGRFRYFRPNHGNAEDIGLTIHVNNGLGTIKLGYDDYADKYKRLQEVLFYFRSGKDFEKVRSIDLNNPDRIVVNINTGASSAMGYKEV